MKDLYNELYSKIPENVAQPINVANPTPLYNSTVIKENGKYDVSSFASADVSVSGGGSLNNKKISITIVSNLSSMLTWTCDYFISENNYVTINSIEIPANSQIVQDLMIPMTIVDDVFYYELPPVNPLYYTVSASDPVNCTFNFGENGQELVVTDPTMDASVTLTYSRL